MVRHDSSTGPGQHVSRNVDALGRSSARRYRTLLRYAIPAAPTLGLVALVTLAASGLSLLEPWPMKILIDHVLTENAADGTVVDIIRFLPNADSRSGLLAWVAGAGLMIFALGSVVEIILTDAWVRAGQRITYGLAGDVFARLQRRSQALQRGTSIGDSMTRVMADSWCVNTLVDIMVFKPVFALITGAGILTIMVRMDPRLTLVCWGHGGRVHPVRCGRIPDCCISPPERACSCRGAGCPP